MGKAVEQHVWTQVAIEPTRAEFEFSELFNDLMLHRFEIENHGLGATGRRHVEVFTVPSESCMAVSVNMCHKWVGIKKLPQ